MKLHKNKQDFKDLIKLAADHFKISEVYVEKDYWVTLILKTLSESEYKNQIIFKGGTSLSKAYGIIERFSEDIDLQLINFSGSDGQKKKLMKKIEQALTTELTYHKDHPRESKSGNIRKTIYSYDKVSEKDDFFQASKELILEINGMSIPEPWEPKEINSYISEYLIQTGHSDAVKEFELEHFSVNVLNKKRTFVEKIFAILDFSFEDDYQRTLSNKIRHVYDISKLYNDKDVQDFFNSNDFFEIANRVVVENDFFGQRKDRTYCDSRFYKEDILKTVEKTYNDDFSKFVFGVLPDFNQIKEDTSLVLEKIKIWEEKYRK
ncbi:MAG: nucleotidyl transferase AbiEii/AbiGii toxin family protein [Psychrilyobacter sp.]|uniref:nucleotidyl transferase AbiEii/AbiGii toxin family protein n=1 Tax=Psychrilyobacter sp. TaxID=2586924 RepID=UPI003C78D7E6